MALPFLVGTGPRSLAFAHRTRAATRVFSIVTMLCQAWFIGWAARHLPGEWTLAALAALAALLALGRAKTPWFAAAALCWLATLAAAAVYLADTPSAHLPALLADEFAAHPAALYALPLVFAGFAASPCLDRTFLHALHACPNPRRAFALAFPLPFAAMLLVSLADRDELGPLMLQPGPATPAWLVPLLAAIILQLGFTTVLHARHLRARPALRAGLAATAAALLAWRFADVPTPLGHTLGALVYRASIGFYGVLVPCYVWAIARPGRHAPTHPLRWPPLTIALTLAALALAAIPMLLDPAWRILYPAALVLIAATRLVPQPRNPPGEPP